MDKKIKFLHIEERFHPAMGYQVNFFAKYHSEKFEFHILTSKSLSIWKTTAEEVEKLDRDFEQNYNVKIHRVDALFDRENKRNILLKGVKKQVLAINPDIIFLHAIESFTALIFFLKFSSYKKFKIVTDTHTLYNQFKSSLSSKLNVWLFKKIVIPKINKHKILSFGTVPENVEILKDVYKINSDLVIELPIGTDLKQYQYSEDERIKIRSDFSIDDKTSVLLYTGKFDNNKKPHLIIDAIKQIEDKITSKLMLFFVGSKPSEYFDKYFKDIKFTNNLISVKVLSFVDSKELYKYYSMADFAVLPTENSLSALDMQACNLPVIMQKDTTNIDRLKKGGLVFEINNLDDMAEKIQVLLNDKSKIKTLGKNGYLYVKQKFEYYKIVEKLEKILLSY